MHFQSISLSCLSILLLFLVVVDSIQHATPPKQLRSTAYYMPLEETLDIDDVLQNSGLRDFIFAFVLATNQGECIPTWNGNSSLKVANDEHVKKIIEKIRQNGGDVSISFGGYNGVELAHACQSVQQLAEAYQIVIDQYHLTHIDFDIEGDDLGVAIEEKRRFDAIKILKANAKSKGKQLFVSLTMPTTIVGMNEADKAEIKRAIDDQLDIDLYMLMAFDFGGQAQQQTQAVISIMESFHHQLKTLRQDLTTDEQVQARSGMILMNGHTDQPSELYTPTTFRELIQYAVEKKLSRVSFWSLNRDRPCPSNRTVGWAAPFCSSVSQQPYEFSKIVAQFEQNRGNDKKTTQPPHHIVTTEKSKSTTKTVVTTIVSKTSTTSKPIIDETVDCKHITDQRFFPFKNDCHQYIECNNGQKLIRTCAAGTIFDTELHICNFERDVHRPECKSTDIIFS